MFGGTSMQEAQALVDDLLIRRVLVSSDSLTVINDIDEIAVRNMEW